MKSAMGKRKVEIREIRSAKGCACWEAEVLNRVNSGIRIQGRRRFKSRLSRGAGMGPVSVLGMEKCSGKEEQLPAPEAKAKEKWEKKPIL